MEKCPNPSCPTPPHAYIIHEQKLLVIVILWLIGDHDWSFGHTLLIITSHNKS